MSYNYITNCYVCHEPLDLTQLPEDNTEDNLGTMYGNEYVLLKMRPTKIEDDGRGRGVNLILHSEVSYRHRSHGEPGERPYKI